VATLKAERKNATFPRIRLSALPELTRLIDAGSTPQRTFGGLALSSAEGKDLIRCLYLAALAERCPDTDKGASRSWFGWVDSQRKKHPILKTIDVRNWQSYRQTIDNI
jgi:hypothetical protein